MEDRNDRLSVVIPFNRNLRQLAECLQGLGPPAQWAEVIVVADGALERCQELAAGFGARVIEIAGPRGPAVARNRGAAAATGDIIVFVDADVIVAPGTLAQIRDRLRQRPDVAAIFGAYDERPRDPGFVSQYKNLSHCYIHQASRSEARTFWSGLGAVRRQAFDAVGGFDERFRRPCVEDIELGYRMSEAGSRILLDPTIQGCHLKHWTVTSAIVSDLRDRGIPWTQLMLKFARVDNDLNLQTNQRVAVVLAYLLLPLVVLSAISRLWLAAAVVDVIALAGLNARYYAFFARRRGLWFALRVFPLHVIHHLCNGLSFVLGCAIFYATSRIGVAIPGAIPLTRWRSNASGLSMVD